MYQIDPFRASAIISLPAWGIFSCSRSRGTQETCGFTTTHAWASAEVRGAFPGPSMPRTVANNQGETPPTWREMTPPRGSCITCRRNFEQALHAVVARCCGEQAAKMTIASHSITYSRATDTSRASTYHLRVRRVVHCRSSDAMRNVGHKQKLHRK